MGRGVVSAAEEGRRGCFCSLRSAHRQSSQGAREGRCTVRTVCLPHSRVVLVCERFPRECQHPPQSEWARALGCDSAVIENGYPLGSDSVVSTPPRCVRVIWPLLCALLADSRVRPHCRRAVASLALVRLVVRSPTAALV